MLKLSYLYASYRANVSEMYHNNGNKKNRLIMKRSGSILRYFNAWYIKIQFSSYPGFNLWCSSFSDCWSNLTKPYWLYLLINFSIGNAKIIPSSLVTSLLQSSHLLLQLMKHPVHRYYSEIYFSLLMVMSRRLFVAAW